MANSSHSSHKKHQQRWWLYWSTFIVKHKCYGFLLILIIPVIFFVSFFFKYVLCTMEVSWLYWRGRTRVFMTRMVLDSIKQPLLIARNDLLNEKQKMNTKTICTSCFVAIQWPPLCLFSHSIRLCCIWRLNTQRHFHGNHFKCIFYDNS